MRALYITWDGPGSNYHESLFIPILERARRSNDEIHLLQFSWDSDPRSESIARCAVDRDMHYIARPIWRRPPLVGTSATLAMATAAIVRYARDHKIDLLIPRSIIPAAVTLTALRFLPSSTRFLYDADGFMADERVDFAGWRRSHPPYLILRAAERAATSRADGIIVRSRAAASILSRRTESSKNLRFYVVANGSDPAAFHPGTHASRARTRSALGIAEGTPLIVYSGSLGGKYRLDVMCQLASRIYRRRRDTVFLILSTTPSLAKQAVGNSSVPSDNLRITTAAPGQVGEYLAAADLGLAVIEPAPSMRGVSPIKVGEYLLCGLPCIFSSGIGDLDKQLDVSVGHSLRSFAPQSLDGAADWFTSKALSERDAFRAACRERGLLQFNIETTAAQYRQAIHDLELHMPTMNSEPTTGH